MRKAMLLLCVVLLMVSTSALAQNSERVKKMSLETRLFLNQQKLEKATGKRLKAKAKDEPTDSMDAIVQINGATAKDDLRGLGVRIKYDFDGFVLAKIPMGRILDVIDLKSVRKVSKSRRMRPATDSMRIATQAGDVLMGTSAAREMGVTTSYTGKGVLVGVLDSGFDYNHKAFKAADGTCRIKKVLRHGEECALEDLLTGKLEPSTDNHGTHTASIAAGANVKEVDGKIVVLEPGDSTYQYGGMAPEADIFLGEGLMMSDLITGFMEMAKYSKENNLPCVVNCSWGFLYGPCNGKGEIESALAKALEINPNMVISKSAGNEAYYALHATKEIAAPDDVMRVALSTYSREKMIEKEITDFLACAAARDPNVPLAATLYVIDTTAVDNQLVFKTEQKLYGDTLTDAEFDIIYEKTGFMPDVHIEYDSIAQSYLAYAYCLLDDSIKSWDGPDMQFVLEVSPAEGFYDFTLDAWAVNGYFSKPDKIDLFDLEDGDNLCSISSDSFDENVICVGSYVTRTLAEDPYRCIRDTAYVNVRGAVTLSPQYGTDGEYFQNSGVKRYYSKRGDISLFSSFNVGNDRPTLPFVSAPGEIVYSAVNHSSTAYMYADSSEYELSCVRVNEDSINPYGSMYGTSMSAPCVTGIVALWMECAQRNGITLNLDSVKHIIEATCDYDEFTGPKESPYMQFGRNGKINALKGIAYILNLAASSGIAPAENGERSVEHVRYVNLNGIESDTPHKGINLVVTRYTDGRESVKKVKFER